MKLKNYQSENTYKALLMTVCLILIVLHGKQDWGFKVDATTLGLLVLCFIPWFRKILTTIKAGGLELQFREYTVHQQIFIFLDGVASKRNWTFYHPRDGEIALGQGFAVLIDELLIFERKKLVEKLESWLKEGNDNHKWFATEVIGYARIDELEKFCENVYKKLDFETHKQPWELNCLWAYSRFHNYEALINELEKTKNKSNQQWMIVACLQMIREEKEEHLIERLNNVLQKFPKETNDLINVFDKTKVEGVH